VDKASWFNTVTDERGEGESKIQGRGGDGRWMVYMRTKAREA
jgi:hypothetical protein